MAPGHADNLISSSGNLFDRFLAFLRSSTFKPKKEQALCKIQCYGKIVFLHSRKHLIKIENKNINKHQIKYLESISVKLEYKYIDLIFSISNNCRVTDISKYFVLKDTTLQLNSKAIIKYDRVVDRTCIMIKISSKWKAGSRLCSYHCKILKS